MSLDTVLIGIGLALYAGASLASILAYTKQASSRERLALVLLVTGAVPFVVVLLRHGFNGHRIPVFGRFEAISWYSLAVSFAFIHMAAKERTRGIGAILVPYVTLLLCVAAPAMNVAVAPDVNTRSVWLGIHVLTAFCGYAMFTLASMLAIAYLVQDRNLKRGKFGRVFENLPDLETLDDLMYRQMRLAFFVFTLSIAAGFVLTRQTGWAPGWAADPKILGTLGTWAVYAVLFHLRVFADRHGRKIAIATVVAMAFVLFTFIGVHMVLDSAHDFAIGFTGGN